MTRTANLIVAALALAACNTEPADADSTSTEALPTAQVAPPGAGGLTLTVDGVMENGNQMTFTVTGAQPGQNVYLIFGRDEQIGSLCPAPLGGLCFDVQNPRILGIPQNPLVADATGTATITLNAPGTRSLPDGFVAWFQAATTGATAATSNTVPKFNPRDTGGIFSVDILDGYDVDLAAPSLSGSRFEIYYSAAYAQAGTVNPGNGLDLCVIEFDADSSGLGALPACTNCDFAFEVTYSNGQDSSVSGDCNYFFALDPTTIAPFSDGFGYNSNYNIPGYGYYPVAMFYYATGGYWTWLTTGVYYNAGYFAWGLQQLGFYWYP